MQNCRSGSGDSSTPGTWREGSLLNVAMEVLWVLVEHVAAIVMHWELLSWPDLGDIERVETQLLGI